MFGQGIVTPIRLKGMRYEYRTSEMYYLYVTTQCHAQKDVGVRARRNVVLYLLEDDTRSVGVCEMSKPWIHSLSVLQCM